jgi:PPOX class probable F420-dependent enzyme
VSTPVWVGRHGDGLVVLTPKDSGKVKRLRHDPRVELRPCGRFGAVEDGAVAVSGRARIGDQPDDEALARAAIRRTYPIESRIVLGIERLAERLRRKPRTERLALFIISA